MDDDDRLVLPTLLPLLEPTDAAERRLWLRLLRSRRVGPTTFWRLLAETGDAAAALELLAAGRGGGGRRRLCAPVPIGVVDAELRAGERAGARLAALPDPDYPAALRDLADAPPLVWIKGDAQLPARPAVALVGARNASSLGLRMATRLARGLSARRAGSSSRAWREGSTRPRTRHRSPAARSPSAPAAST